VLSNVCDITEIKKLHEKLRSAEAIAEHYQRELHAKNAEDWLSLGIFRSRIMEELYDLVKKVADTELPLLMMGESGVGKTALAKYIYNLSQPQNGGNFVHINCSAIPEALLESELFGYEPGAFTGANKAKVGLFEIARDGMILLDEIGDMPLTLQAKLLNVLQEKNFYRVGGTKIIKTNARVIAATNQNLEHLIAEGRFRRDLYFRLNVIPITIPPLRERKEDVATLIVHLLEESNKRHKRSKAFATSTLTILLSYEWPGNIRELMNMIERLVVLTKEDIIEPHHLPPELACSKIMNHPSRSCSGSLNNANDKTLEPLWEPGQPLKLAISQIEGQIIDQAIDLYGSVKLAAKKLAVDESTLTRKRSRMNNPSGHKLHMQK
jgi:transcriptional regulator with PAS, ATPase and Fis domain